MLWNGKLSCVTKKIKCCQISTKNFFDFGTGKYLGRVNILNLDKKWLFYLLKSNGKSNNYSWGGRFGFLIACRDILKLISRFDRSLNLLSDTELHSVDQESMDDDELVIGSEVPFDPIGRLNSVISNCAGFRTALELFYNIESIWGIFYKVCLCELGY